MDMEVKLFKESGTHGLYLARGPMCIEGLSSILNYSIIFLVMYIDTHLFDMV